jgi:hypothetical protein
MKMPAFWNMVSCSLVEVDRRFTYRRTAYIIKAMIIGPDGGGNTRLRNAVYFYETARRHIPESCHLQ